MSQFTFTLNGREVTAGEGQTILQAALAHGVAIPRLCHDPRLAPTGACRLCCRCYDLSRNRVIDLLNATGTALRKLGHPVDTNAGIRAANQVFGIS